MHAGNSSIAIPGPSLESYHEPGNLYTARFLSGTEVQPHVQQMARLRNNWNDITHVIRQALLNYCNMSMSTSGTNREGK